MIRKFLPTLLVAALIEGIFAWMWGEFGTSHYGVQGILGFIGGLAHVFPATALLGTCAWFGLIKEVPLMATATLQFLLFWAPLVHLFRTRTRKPKMKSRVKVPRVRDLEN